MGSPIALSRTFLMQLATVNDNGCHSITNSVNLVSGLADSLWTSSTSVPPQPPVEGACGPEVRGDRERHWLSSAGLQT